MPIWHISTNRRKYMQKKVVVLAAAAMMVVPVLGNAAPMAGSNTVNSSAIVDGAVATADIANKAVTTAKIADSAVTDAKISGTISASKIAPISQGQVTGLAAALAGKANATQVTALETALTGKSDTTHNHDALYQKKYGKVTVVATSGGDYASPEAALGDLATWCSEMPCLVKVMPGTYTASGNGMSGIEVPGHVTIEGSGEANTNIICGAIFLYNDAEIRSLTITSNNPIYGYYNPMGPWYVNSTGPAIARNLTLNTLSNDAAAVTNEFGNLQLSHVSINVIGSGTGNGVGVNSLGNISLKDVTISMPSGGTGISSSYGATVSVSNSAINLPGSAVALAVGNYGGSINVNNSQINGTVVPNTGSIKCINSFNANYDAITCQ